MPSIHTVWQNYKLTHPNSLYHLFIVFKTKGNLNNQSKELVALVWNLNGPHARILLSIGRRQNRNSWYIANVLGNWGDYGTFQKWELGMWRKWLRMGPWSLTWFCFLVLCDMRSLHIPLWLPWSKLFQCPLPPIMLWNLNLLSSTVSVIHLGQCYMKLIFTVVNIKVCQ